MLSNVDWLPCKAANSGTDTTVYKIPGSCLLGAFEWLAVVSFVLVVHALGASRAEAGRVRVPVVSRAVQLLNVHNRDASNPGVRASRAGRVEGNKLAATTREGLMGRSGPRPRECCSRDERGKEEAVVVR